MAVQDKKNIQQSPDFKIQKYREMMIAPLSMDDITKKDARFLLKATQMYQYAYNYLQFFDILPSEWEYFYIENLQELEQAYSQYITGQDASVNSVLQTVGKKEVFQEKKEFKKWLSYLWKEKREKAMSNYALKKKDVASQYTLPDSLKIKIVSYDAEKLKKENVKYLLTNIKVEKKNTLRIIIYDFITNKTLINFIRKIPKFILEKDQVQEKQIINFVKKMVYEMFLKYKYTQFYTLNLKNKEPLYNVYIDNKLVLTSDIFLSQGTHSILITYNDNTVKKGVFDIEHDLQLTLQHEQQKKKNYFTVTVKTKPEQVAVFIDEDYQGLTPLNIQLPRGNYHLRATSVGYGQINYNLKVKDQKSKQNIQLDLQELSEKYKKKLKLYSDLKRGTFFTGLLFTTGLIYGIERTFYYKEAFLSGIRPDYNYKKFIQFQGLSYGFLAGSIGFFTIALVAQIFELKYSDIGVGVADDGRLGIRWRF